VPLFYLDTAAVLKRYRTEPGSAVVDELLDARTAADTLASSRFTLLEGTAVARRLLKGRLLRRRAYAALMARFLQEMGTAVTLAPVTDALIADATLVAEQHALRTGDAVQLAAAIALHRTSPGERWVFVTNDRQLAEAARAAGFDVLNPESATALAHLRRLRSHR
jgi:predicted nucleic acid-binding protein